ncbi:hypothetical protein GCM10027440_29600 [Nocardiopsis coralliicola]
MVRRRAAALLLATVLACTPAAGAAADSSGGGGSGGSGGLRGGGNVPEGAELAFRIDDERVTESSGLAASARHDGVYWTHNDSGDYPAEVYAVDSSGAVAAAVGLTGDGVELRDWEAIAVAEDADGRAEVFVGDIGDNHDGGWPSVRVYRFAEPETLADTSVEAEAFTLVYADGARNAESLMVDPRDGRLYVVSKEFGGSLYAAPEELDPDGENVLERIGPAPAFATDATFAPDGSAYAIRTYWGATVYEAADGVPGPSRTKLGLPETEQGESLAFTPDGTALMAGSEGAQSPVYSVPVPDPDSGSAADAADPAEAAPADGSAPDPDGASGSGGRGLLLGGAAVAALVIGAIVFLARKA